MSNFIIDSSKNNIIIGNINNLVNISNAYLHNVSIFNLSSINLSSLNISTTNLSSVQFFTTNLSTVNLSTTNLSSVNLSTTNLSSVNISTTNLSSVNLSTTNLSSVNISTTNLSSMNISTTNLSTTNLSSVNVSTTNLSTVNLSTTNLSSVNISTTNLSSVNISTRNLSSVNFSTTNISTVNLSTTNLSSVNLSTTNLSSVNISTINLSSVNLSTSNLSSVNISTTNLSSVNISTTNLSTTNLSSVNISTRNLSSVNFSTTNILTVNLSTTNLSSVNVSTTNLSSVNISSVNISTVNLSTTNLSSVNLSTTNLSSINISTTNLSTVNFSTTNILTVNLSTTNLSSVNISTTNLSSVNISTTNFLTKKLIVDNTNLTINPQIFTDTIYSTKINTTLYTQKPSGTIILGNNINTTIPKLIVNNMSLTNTILGNITKINSINVNVNNNVQYLETQKLYFNSTNSTITTTIPSTNNNTEITLTGGTNKYLINTYTFTTNPFINFINNQVIIELRVCASVTNTNYATQINFEIYKNNQISRTSGGTYYINEISTDTTNPYIIILETNIGESTINDVFSIKLYFTYVSTTVPGFIGNINLDKSSITIMNVHNKGYEYIEKNRYASNDITLLHNVDSFIGYPFFITKGCWIIEASLTFYVHSTGIHEFYIKSKNNFTNTIVNTTQYYWGNLTTAGANHTVKTRQIINTYTYMQIQLIMTWINAAGNGSIVIRGSSTFPTNHYIRYIKIG